MRCCDVTSPLLMRSASHVAQKVGPSGRSLSLTPNMFCCKPCVASVGVRGFRCFGHGVRIKAVENEARSPFRTRILDRYCWCQSACCPSSMVMPYTARLRDRVGGVSVSTPPRLMMLLCSDGRSWRLGGSQEVWGFRVQGPSLNATLGGPKPYLSYFNKPETSWRLLRDKGKQLSSTLCSSYLPEQCFESSNMLVFCGYPCAN